MEIMPVFLQGGGPYRPLMEVTFKTFVKNMYVYFLVLLDAETNNKQIIPQNK